MFLADLIPTIGATQEILLKGKKIHWTLRKIYSEERKKHRHRITR